MRYTGILGLLALALSGCVKPPAPMPTLDPPQVRVLRYATSGIVLVDVIATGLGVCSTPDCMTVRRYLLKAGEGFARTATTVASSSSDWATTRIKLSAIWAGVSTDSIIIDSTLRAGVAEMEALKAQILEAQ